jgi:hypothetical protein
VLPLVDEHRSLTLEQARWVGLRDGELGGVIQTMHRLGALERCAGLPDALWAFDGDGRQVAEKLVNLVVDDAALVRGSDAHLSAEYQSVTLKRSLAAGAKDRLRHPVKTNYGNF